MGDSVPISAGFPPLVYSNGRRREPEIGYLGDSNRLPRCEEKDKLATKSL